MQYLNLFISYHDWTENIHKAAIRRLNDGITKINATVELNNKNSIYIQRTLIFLLYQIYCLVAITAYCVSEILYLLPAIVLSMTSLPPIIALYCLDFLTLMSSLTPSNLTINLRSIIIHTWISLDGNHGFTTAVKHAMKAITNSIIMSFSYLATLKQQEDNYECAQLLEAEAPQQKSFAYRTINLLLAIPNFIISIPFRIANALDKGIEYTLETRASSLSNKTLDRIFKGYRITTALLYAAMMQPSFIATSTLLANTAYLAVPAISIFPIAAAAHVAASTWLCLTGCFTAAMYFYNTKRWESQQKTLTNRDPDTIAIKKALDNNNFADVLSIYKSRPKLVRNTRNENAGSRENRPLSDFWPTILEERINLKQTFFSDISQEESTKLSNDETIIKECPITRDLIEHPVYRVSENGIKIHYEALALLQWLQKSDIDPCTSETITSFDDIHYDVEMKQKLDARVASAREASNIMGTTIISPLLFDYSKGKAEDRKNPEQTQGWRQRCAIC